MIGLGVMTKVVDSTVSDNELSSTIDLELDKVPVKLRAKVKRDVGEYLVEQTLASMSEQKSPVTGKGFKKLSKEYKKQKEKSGRSGVPDLELSGDLKDSLKYKPTKEGVKIGHFDDEAPKADGHNNFSGKSQLPPRQYIPKKGENYKGDIKKEVEAIVNEAMVNAMPISETKLKSLGSKSEFWALLEATYEGLSRPEIKDAVARSPGFYKALRNVGILHWLK